MKRRVIIMGAAGRDFHNFNVVFRDDLECDVVAFTAATLAHIIAVWWGVPGQQINIGLAGLNAVLCSVAIYALCGADIRLALFGAIVLVALTIVTELKTRHPTRSAAQFDEDPGRLPGSRGVAPDDLVRHHDGPKDPLLPPVRAAS